MTGADPAAFAEIDGRAQIFEVSPGRSCAEAPSKRHRMPKRAAIEALILGHFRGNFEIRPCRP